MLTGNISSSMGNISLSKIVLGTDGYGTRTSVADAFRLLDYYYAAGGRTLDTAKVYGTVNVTDSSPSENTVGEWINSRGVRKDISIITKGGHPDLSTMHTSRLSRDEILFDIEMSQKTLTTDCIDLYFLHRDDQNIPVEEIIDTMDYLVKSGYTKAYGVSNWTVDRINKANDYAKAQGKAGITASEIQWGLAKTTPEDIGDDTLVCMNDKEYSGYLNNKIPVLAYSSQSKGLISKYISGGEDILTPKIIQRFFNERNLCLAQRVKLLSEKYSVSPAAVVLAYITCNLVDGYAIIGCSKLSQLQDSLSGSDFTLSKDDIKYLDE